MNKLDHYVLVCIGAGGTGTYFLKEISRYLSFKNREKLSAMIIIDGDTVERKNLARQAFMPDDIGCNKAAVMADVLNEAFDLNWKTHTNYLESASQLDSLIKAVTPSYALKTGAFLPVIIGCVDNHGCRLICEQYFRNAENCLYFDAANEFDSGETVFSVKIDKTVYSPTRSYYFPDMLSGDVRGRSEMSCEELNQSAPQHILANMASAMQLLAAFTSFFDEGTLTCGYSVYNPFTHYNKFYNASDCKWKPRKVRKGAKYGNKR